MNAKSKTAAKSPHGLNMMVFERFSAQQRRALMKGLYNRGYFENDQPEWLHVLNGIQKGYVKEHEYIKILTDRQLSQLYSPPLHSVGKKVDWEPSEIKREIRKHSKPLYDAWNQIREKERKQAVIVAQQKDDLENFLNDVAPEPDKTQRDFMRELFMKHADADSDYLLSPAGEKAIIKDYMVGERDGVVVRRSRKTGITASQYARSLLTDGTNQGWIYEYIPVEKESDDVISRVTKAINKSGLSIKQIGTRCGVTDKHVYNWRNTGQIARQFLLPFARVTSTEAFPVTVDWILGGAESDRVKADTSGLVPEVDPVWFRRAVKNEADEMGTETTRLVPMVSGQQALAWDTDTRQFWSTSPEQFSAVPTIDWADSDGSDPAFAYQIDQDGFTQFNNLDVVLFDDECLPKIGDFCLFKVSRYEDQDGKVVFVGDPQLAMGYFYPIGGKPDMATLENYWKKIKGISLTENQDGSTGRYDEEYRLSDGWYCELIGVAIEITRPLIGARRVKLVHTETVAEEDLFDQFIKKNSPEDFVDMILNSEGGEEIMNTIEERLTDAAGDQYIQQMIDIQRGK